MRGDGEVHLLRQRMRAKIVAHVRAALHDPHPARFSPRRARKLADRGDCLGDIKDPRAAYRK